MTKQRIQIGAINSGSGDTLRAAMIKINNNFDELYDLQGQDSSGQGIDINGNTIDLYENYYIEHTNNSSVTKYYTDGGTVFKDIDIDFDTQVEGNRTVRIGPKTVEERVESLKEANPMLGHRGCRLGISYPEVTAMQARAIIGAAAKLKKEGNNPKVELMIPLVSNLEEFLNQKEIPQ